MHWIYSLVDKNDRVVYIGRTSNPLRRLKEHRAKMRKGGAKRGLYTLAWPTIKMKLIEYTDNEYTSRLREIHWILHHLTTENGMLMNQTIDKINLRKCNNYRFGNLLEIISPIQMELDQLKEPSAGS